MVVVTVETSLCTSVCWGVHAWFYYGWLVGLQRYTGIFFCHDTNIIYWTSYRAIFTIHLRMPQQRMESTVFNAGRFFKQTDEKNPCWAVFSIIFQDGGNNKRMRASNKACQLYRLQSPRARHKATSVFCCYVTFHIMYRIMTTVLGYVSYLGKMYHYRPSGWVACRSMDQIWPHKFHIFTHKNVSTFCCRPARWMLVPLSPKYVYLDFSSPNLL